MISQPHLTELYSFYTLVQELRSSSKRSKKEEALTRYLSHDESGSVQKLLHAVYDDFVKYHLTSKVAVHGAVVDGKEEYFDGTTIHDALRLLSERKVTGHAAEKMWTGLLIQLAKRGGKSGLVEIANCILDKDLKCHVGLKSVNKVLKELGLPRVRTFRVALGEGWEGEEVWKDEDVWYASRKLDGVRVLALCTANDVVLRSRKGLDIPTLAKLRDALLKALPKIAHLLPCVLDGEGAIQTKDGSDDFKAMMTQLRRKDHVIENPVLHAFDYIPMDEFQRARGKMPYRDRQKTLREAVELIDAPELKRVKQWRVDDADDFTEYVGRIEANKWEGLILRRAAPYRGKRSTDIYKVKFFKDLEATVVDVEHGEINVQEGGHSSTIVAMTAAVIEYKGNPVGVGSGWTLEERKRFHADPRKLLGKVITVTYKQETKDKRGKPSLQFPVVKVIHGARRVF